jgi:hypothetical protein
MSIHNLFYDRTATLALSSQETGLSSSLAETVPTLTDEMNKVLAAAIVDEKFRDLLLANPDAIMLGGYNGHTFNLGSEEVNFILSVQAVSLTDFAARWVIHKENNCGCIAKSGNGNRSR